MEHSPSWTRRELLRAGAVMSLASLDVGTGGEASLMPVNEQPNRLRTRVSDLLGIDVPILQAPMSGVVTPALAAAVSNAGALGILPGVMVPPGDLRAQIRATRAATSRPFGVNLLMHTAMQPPIDPAVVPEATVERIQRTLNGFREKLGIPALHQRPPRPPDLLAAALDVIVEERVPVWSIGLGRPTEAQIERCRKQGTKVIAMAATVEDARELDAAGVDVVIAQGSEAGGHRSTWTKRPSAQHAAIGALALVPQVVAAVKAPVVAAGGIVDGRGLVAALALGAHGVLVGTRFIATRESAAPAFYKQRVLDASSDQTVVTDAFTGLYARVIRNEFGESYAASGAPVFPPVVQQVASLDIIAASAAAGRGEFYPMYAGQGCGAVRDMPGAGELIARTIAEAKATLAALRAVE